MISKSLPSYSSIIVEIKDNNVQTIIQVPNFQTAKGLLISIDEGHFICRPVTTSLDFPASIDIVIDQGVSTYNSLGRPVNTLKSFYATPSDVWIKYKPETSGEIEKSNMIPLIGFFSVRLFANGQPIDLTETNSVITLKTPSGEEYICKGFKIMFKIYFIF